jgi:Uma2 family endonuclease
MTNGTATLEPKAKKPAGLHPGVPVRLHGLDWAGYRAICELIGERRFRTFYADGEMEILALNFRHSRWVAVLGRLIEDLSDELRIQRRSVGMATLIRDDLELAIEPDRSYYFTNESRIRGKLELNFSSDPPPDMAIELASTNSSDKRMQVYARFGVPEVWRFDGRELTVNQLNRNRHYSIIDRSRYFQAVPMSELMRFIGMSSMTDDTTLSLAFRNWVRERLAAR